MDGNECSTIIHAARTSAGKSKEEIIRALTEAGKKFNENVASHFTKRGEW